MAGIPQVAESMLAAALIGKSLLSRRKSRMDTALTGLSILLCGAGIFLSVLGLERFLETRYRPDTAAFLSAVFVFTIALLAALAKHLKNAHEQRSFKNTGNEIEKSIRGIAETIHHEMNAPVRDNPKMAILIAAIAGFAAMHGRR